MSASNRKPNDNTGERNDVDAMSLVTHTETLVSGEALAASLSSTVNMGLVDGAAKFVATEEPDAKSANPGTPDHQSSVPEASDGKVVSAPTKSEQSPSTAYVAKAQSFARFKLAQNYDEVAGTSKVLVHVAVGKPSPQTWFRVHPDEAFRMAVAVLTLKDEGETYIVSPDLAMDHPTEITPVLLVTYVTRQGVIGIWPLRQPRSDGRTDGWMRSASDAAQIAMTRWVRLQANRAAGAYDVRVTKADLADPEWPDANFEKLLELGFEDHIIEDMSHPVLRRLRGEV